MNERVECGMCQQGQETYPRKDRPGRWHVSFSRKRNWSPCRRDEATMRSYNDYYDGEWRNA